MKPLAKQPRYGTVRWSQRDMQRMKPPMQWAADEIEKVLGRRPSWMGVVCWVWLVLGMAYIFSRI